MHNKKIVNLIIIYILPTPGHSPVSGVYNSDFSSSAVIGTPPPSAGIVAVEDAAAGFDFRPLVHRDSKSQGLSASLSPVSQRIVRH